jgi:hypothetical protein
MRLLCVLAIATALAVSEARSEITIALFDSVSGPCLKASAAIISAIEKAKIDVVGAGVFGEKVRFAFPDAQCDPKKAQAEAQKLITDDLRLVIWLPTVSSLVRLVAERVFASVGIMQVSLSASEPAQAYAAVQVWAKAAQLAGAGANASRIADMLREIDVDTEAGKLSGPRRARSAGPVTEILSFVLGTESVSLVREGAAPKTAQLTIQPAPPPGQFSGPSGPPRVLPSGPPPPNPPSSNVPPATNDTPGPMGLSKALQFLGELGPSQRAEAQRTLERLDSGSFIRTEAPGTGVGGAAPAATPSSNSATGPTVGQSITNPPPATGAEKGNPDRIAQNDLTIPALPMPDVSSGICRYSADAPIPTDSEFLRKYRETIDKQTGKSGIGFCQEGFSDVVMIDNGSGLVCSGVVLPRGWVLTARHCIGEHFAGDGKVYRMRGEHVSCLKRHASAASSVHPGAACKLDTLAVDRARVESLTHDGRQVDIVLIAPPRDYMAPTEAADLKEVYSGITPLLTFAGFGRSDVPGEREAGILRLSWGLGTWDAVTRKRVEISLVGVTVGDAARDRNASTPCGGDSGGPAFLGRVFGYSNERHELFGILVAQTSGGTCRIEGTLDTTFKIVAVQSEPVLTWICHTTNGALAACRNRR